MSENFTGGKSGVIRSSGKGTGRLVREQIGNVETRMQDSMVFHTESQESIQQFCVQESMTDVEGKHFKMGVDGWDFIGQCTASLMTVAVVVKQVEGG